MYNFQKTGRSMFAIGMIALAICCFIFKDFIVGRPPAWPAGFSLNPGLAYATGTLLLACAIAILADRYSTQAAYTIAGLIVVFSIARHVPVFMTTWPNAYKSIALVGSCLIIAAAKKENNNNGLVVSGIIFLAVFLIVCGYSHFKYADFVDTLIPAYIPFHHFWTYCCGVLLLAGGIGLVLPRTRRLAALLSGCMIAGWFILLHIPRFLADTSNPSDAMGVCESFAFAGICFYIAAIFSKENKFAAVVDPGTYLGEMQ